MSSAFPFLPCEELPRVDLLSEPDEREHVSVKQRELVVEVGRMHHAFAGATRRQCPERSLETQLEYCYLLCTNNVVKLATPRRIYEHGWMHMQMELCPMQIIKDQGRSMMMMMKMGGEMPHMMMMMMGSSSQHEAQPGGMQIMMASKQEAEVKKPPMTMTTPVLTGGGEASAPTGAPETDDSKGEIAASVPSSTLKPTIHDVTSFQPSKESSAPPSTEGTRGGAQQRNNHHGLLEENRLLIGFLVVSILLTVFVFFRGRRRERENQDWVARYERQREDHLQEMDNLHQQLQASREQQQRQPELQRELQVVVANMAQLQHPEEGYYPDHWEDNADQEARLVPVSQESQEFQSVLNRLQESLEDARITKLWRVQNKYLFAYYMFHKERFARADIPLNERKVWHGTGRVMDPINICQCRLDGLMMQFSNEDNYWGRGIYFAENAVLSDDYSFQAQLAGPTPEVPGRDRGEPRERELLLVNLLVGRARWLNQTPALTMPPRIDENDPNSDRYNTVEGILTGGQTNQRVFVVFENGRGYPEYLVRYTTGDMIGTGWPAAQSSREN